MGLAPVIGFLYARGVNVLAPSLDGLFEIVRSQSTIALADDPSGVVTTIGTDEADLTIRLDEHLSVVAVSG
jgi:hypothetical protein